MDAEGTKNLQASAEAVLKSNDYKNYTVPAGQLYPHQWLWDSCFAAIGLRHLDIDRSMREITSLLRGQWSNGMLPNMIFSSGKNYRRDRNLWRSWINPFAPDKIATSGITQPPMLAEAIVKIGEKLKTPEKRSWYARVYPALLAYHEWMYAERDPHGEGLIVLVHPYESGMDSSPAWSAELYAHGTAWWVRAARLLRIDALAGFFRRDTQVVPANHRSANFEAMAYWAAMLRLRRKAYNSQAILQRPLFAVEDLAFNSILVRANQHLGEIAKTLGKTLPEELAIQMQKTVAAVDTLWDEGSGQFYSRCFISRDFIEVPTVSTLLPLYAGTIDSHKAERLVEIMKSPKHFAANWPLPTVPPKSEYFDAVRYWQGPSWVNINWLVIDGLERYGYKKEAEELKTKTLEMVAKGGMNEYFDPLNGQPAGVPDFSWTAALTIDLLRR